MSYENNNIPNLLIVDHDSHSARQILAACAERGIGASVAECEKTAIDYLSPNLPNLVIISDNIAKTVNTSGPRNILKHIKNIEPELPVILLSNKESAHDAIKALRQGFDEYMAKPLEKTKINELLDIYTPQHQAPAVTEKIKKTPFNIIGKSPALTQAVNLAVKIAPTSVPVLISGESGTGKELIAELIHNNSKRANNPYVKLNCAALNDSLLESELFGHEKGAFTGAYCRREGKFEQAHSGTLLLDEITETGPKFQAQLLRVLEQQDFERVGGNENIKINVRVISTTNRDVLTEVRKGNFRQDLYYRLNGVKLFIPPIRQRTEDLAALVWHFVNKFAPEANRKIEKLDSMMMQIFSKYNWPGNVRQLRNVVRTALILGKGPILSIADISWLIDELQPRCQSEIDDNQMNENLAGNTLQEIEQRAIISTLSRSSGNQKKTAETLGISDRTLREKLKKYRREGLLEPAI